MTIRYDLPAADYHADPAIGSSRAKLVLDSIRLFKDDLDGLIPRTPTASMAFGTMAHLAVLEPDRFHDQTTTTGPVNPATGKAYGADTKKFAEWQAENPGLIVVDPSLYVMLERMPKEIRDALQTLGQSEVSAFAEDNGVLIKCRPDRLIEDAIYDLKTINDIDAIDAHIRSYRYWFSAAWYRRVMKIATGIDHSFTLIFAESKPPYRWRIVDLSPELIEEGNYYVADVVKKIGLAQEYDEWGDLSPIRVTAARPVSLGAFDHGEEI